VFIAASTHPGEDEQVLEVFRYLRAQLPTLLLVLVPRHPERFAPVADLIAAHAWRYVHHSKADPVDSDVAVVLGDTMGQMLGLLGASDVAFMGGSLEPVGGHNMLEPLAVGTPVVSGSHVFNFATVAERLEKLGVLDIVSSSLGLAEAVLPLLQDADARAQRARQGIAAVESERGSLQRLCELIVRLLREHSQNSSAPV
jgi:3-deoxy-D-manno-octulosonic-acid transferase